VGGVKNTKKHTGFCFGAMPSPPSPVRAKCTYSFGEFPLVLPSELLTLENFRSVHILLFTTFYRVVLLLLFNTSTLSVFLLTLESSRSTCLITA